ncbi:hypothetical protein [Novilysobacter spongiicola]|uniref:Uncharacterized protein n=1 Tax=Lysobacter spongiicola DSM 21749 TaxID=1122188 RepID=A0A1T4NBY8_9GAMM|nr:hypothetical protein [Lysobacter spongiicola]SJZ76779.1 hypothetical protein SAMN02745674_00829 [Lysobacter spongiicola DSM 21749]
MKHEAQARSLPAADLRTREESGPENAAMAESQPAVRRKWMWIKLAGAACVLSWVALAVGIGMEVDTSTMLVLATLAAVTTEGTIWVAALLLGVSAYQARRRLWEQIRQRMR